MIKKALLLAATALAAVTLQAEDKAPAFPGAEGHGRYVTGGRGGKVLHVTTLEDNDNEGSLRWALTKQSGKRIVVFDVSGTIELKKNLKISGNDVTVLGQTAPGEGITIAYYTVETGGHNIILRFLRFRRSQVKDVNDGADALFFRNYRNIILDHCSFSWSIDEVCSVYDNQNFTLQWSTVFEGLCNPGHTKGAHSYGGIWGGKNASFHHNMIAHVQNRAPRFNGARYKKDNYDKTLYDNTVQGERVDFRNCVLYNWGNGAGCYGGPGGGYINMVNNYYKAGPGTKNKKAVTQVTVGASGNSTPSDLYGYASRYYIKGNYVTAADEPANYDWNGVTYDSGLFMINGERYMADVAHLYGENQTYLKNSKDQDCISLKLDEPIDAGTVTTHSAEEAYNSVLKYCGASLFRDAVDARVIEEARTGTVTYNGDVPYTNADGKTFAKSGTKGIVDWVNDPESATQNPGVPSFPVIKEERRAADFDTDGDGMPDVWETANGLDPNDPEDGNLYTLDPRGWYTNIEVYANGIVEHIIKAQNANAADAVDEYYPVADHTSGIVTVENPDVEIIGFEYYNIQGIRLEEPAQGLNIRRIIYSDGHVETDKVLKR